MLLVRAKRFLRDARPVASRMEPDRIERLDDPLFQEGNEIIARYGCVNELSPRKKAAIKDIGYDFPENGDPRIRLKAYDKGFQLAGKENQKVGQKPAPGTLYSEIAEEIDGVNGLTPVVAPTVTRRSRDRLRLFRPGGQAAFPPPRPDPKPCHRPPVLYGSDGACSAPSAPQPNRKVPREPTTRPRPSVPRSASEPTATLEKQPTRSRRPAASYRPSSAPRASTRSRSRNPQDLAEGTFAAAEAPPGGGRGDQHGYSGASRQAEHRDQGRRRQVSGAYYCHAVRHFIGEGAHYWELKLRKNAPGGGAGDKSVETQGHRNEQEAPPVCRESAMGALSPPFL